MKEIWGRSRGREHGKGRNRVGVYGRGSGYRFREGIGKGCMEEVGNMEKEGIW